MKAIHLFFVSFVLLISCVTNDPEPGLYDDGVLVSNEGNFGSGNATMSHISNDGTVTPDVFSLANGEKAVGDVLQSIYQTDEKIFVIVNNSHVIYALNKKDLTIAYEITQTTLPRYMTHQGNIGYFTEWIETSWTEIGAPGQVKSFDLTTGELLDSARVGHHPEFVALAGSMMYVSNNFDGTMSILDADDLSLLATVETAPSPGQMITTASNDVLLICGGGYDENWLPANDGAILTISDQAITSSIKLNQNPTARMAASPDLSTLYFSTSNKVWSVDLSDGSVSPLLEDSSVGGFHGIGVSPDGTLYLGDHAGYLGAGSVITYSPSGEKLAAYTVGIAPNGFVFLE